MSAHVHLLFMAWSRVAVETIILSYLAFNTAGIGWVEGTAGQGTRRIQSFPHIICLNSFTMHLKVQNTRYMLWMSLSLKLWTPKQQRKIITKNMWKEVFRGLPLSTPCILPNQMPKTLAHMQKFDFDSPILPLVDKGEISAKFSGGRHS